MEMGEIFNAWDARQGIDERDIRGEYIHRGTQETWGGGPDTFNGLDGEMIMLDGTVEFREVKVWCVARQETDRPISEVAAEKFELDLRPVQ